MTISKAVEQILEHIETKTEGVICIAAEVSLYSRYTETMNFRERENV